jgi:cobaltochelatase CobT
MEKENPIANFKTAISSTIKTISEDDNVEITFGNQNSSSSEKVIKLPNLEENTKIDYTSVRAFADSEALKIKYSNLKVYESNKPKGSISKKLYQIAEKIRYEKIGSDKYLGIKSNIQNTYLKKLSGLDLKKSENKTLNAFENYLRLNILNYKNSKDV